MRRGVGFAVRVAEGAVYGTRDEGDRSTRPSADLSNRFEGPCPVGDPETTPRTNPSRHLSIGILKHPGIAQGALW